MIIPSQDGRRRVAFAANLCRAATTTDAALGRLDAPNRFSRLPAHYARVVYQMSLITHLSTSFVSMICRPRHFHFDVRLVK